MSKRFLFAVTIAIVVLSVLACRSGTGLTRTVRGSGHVVERDRVVSGFSGVELATIGALHIEAGERKALRIEAEDNLLSYIETVVPST